MIKSWKHKGLQKFFETGSTSGIISHHAAKLRIRLDALNRAAKIEDLSFPGYRLHPLKGSLSGRWSITVTANWRLTFEFENGNVYILNYEDYH